MIRLLAVPATALAAVLATVAPAQAADDSWDIPNDASIVIEGHGYGHGRGMSQWGAKHAADEGVGYRQILEFYYPGTAQGSATGQLRVWLTKGDLENAVQVHPRSGLTARKVTDGKSWVLADVKPRAQRWRILPKGDGTSILQYLQSGWHKFRQVPGLLEFAAKGKPITLDTQGGPLDYRGVIRSVPSPTTSGNRLAINVLPMENYLRGVVPKESYPSWPQDALRAQSVAARSYSAYHRARRAASAFDVDDTTRYQAYGGVGGEHPSTDQAIAATAGEIRTFEGEPAFTEFTASSGGWTVAGDKPYLTAMADQWDAPSDPNHQWEVSFTDEEIEAAFPAIGNLTRIEITGRDGHGEWGGRAGTVTLTGDQGVATPRGSDFYGKLKLRSAWLTLRVS